MKSIWTCGGIGEKNIRLMALVYLLFTYTDGGTVRNYFLIVDWRP
jgi:hypothetical protein